MWVQFSALPITIQGAAAMGHANYCNTQFYIFKHFLKAKMIIYTTTEVFEQCMALSTCGTSGHSTPSWQIQKIA